MKKIFPILISTVLLGFSAMGKTAQADERIIDISIKDHKFNPSLIEVKSTEKFKLRIKNEDSSSEEFESRELVIEKFIGPLKTIIVTFGPLKAGIYPFEGEFHKATATGKIVVTPDAAPTSGKK